MSTCIACGKEPEASDGCEVPEHIQYVAFGHEKSPELSPRCPECNCLPGKPHHDGCTVEECYSCRRPSPACTCDDGTAESTGEAAGPGDDYDLSSEILELTTTSAPVPHTETCRCPLCRIANALDKIAAKP